MNFSSGVFTHSMGIITIFLSKKLEYKVYLNFMAMG